MIYKIQLATASDFDKFPCINAGFDLKKFLETETNTIGSCPIDVKHMATLT